MRLVPGKIVAVAEAEEAEVAAVIMAAAEAETTTAGNQISTNYKG